MTRPGHHPAAGEQGKKTCPERPRPDADPATRREAVSAFLQTSREGDLEGLVAVLRPDVLLRAGALEVIGGRNVAGRASLFRRYAARAEIEVVLVGGEIGFVTRIDGEPFSIMAFTVCDGLIAAIHVIRDRQQVASLVP